MNRRTFLQLSTIPWWAYGACQNNRQESEGLDFPIHLLDDSIRGHQLMKKQASKAPQEIRKDCLIVGGGVAGLTAACLLKEEDLWLCELSDRLGGSSAYYPHQNLQLCQGAHYELDYPSHFGKEATSFLEKIGILTWDRIAAHWKFRAREFYIAEEQLEQCFHQGTYREDVLADVPQKEIFLALMQEYEAQIPLPTSLIAKRYQHLNQISFQAFLKDKGIQDPQLLQGIDYHMRDDYGAEASTVSALAGIVYYACRPYAGGSLETFSAPMGNAFFVQEFAKQLSAEQIRLGHLLKSIRKEGKLFRAEVLHLESGTVYSVQVPKIIYAAQKHTLKYVFPEYFPYFESIRYAPWVVQNFVMKAMPNREIHWQNETLSSDPAYLGFINSRSQVTSPSSAAVLTAYYCFPDQERNYLLDMSTHKQALTQRSLQHIAHYWDMNKPELADMIASSFIKTYGHGMPIPVPGYLFRDGNLAQKPQNFAFAGTDNGRLPLFLEAVDSGIQAAKFVNRPGASS